MKKNTLLLFCILLFSFTITAQDKIKQEIPVKSFNELRFEGSATWVLIPSTENKLILESKKEDIKDYIEVTYSGGMMVIDVTGKNKAVGKLFQGVTFYVYYKNLIWVELSGTGKVVTEGAIKGDKITATLNGSGKLDIEVDCLTFKGLMQGTSSLIVSGKANTSLVEVEGVGKYKGFELKCHKVDVEVKGVGGAQVSASENLIATLKGVGSIRYIGDPKNKDLDVSGLGSIKKYTE